MFILFYGFVKMALVGQFVLICGSIYLLKINILTVNSQCSYFSRTDLIIDKDKAYSFIRIVIAILKS